MSELATVGIDLAKSVFQIHGVDENGRVLVRRQLRRGQLLAFFEKRPRCLIGMEACAGAHDWGRRLQELGHDVRLMPPSYVKPYMKRGKTDAADAAAICEAVTRPSMRFVAIKSETCSSVMVLHRTRDFLVRQRTQIGNAIRAHLTEFGIIAAKGARSVERLREQLDRLPEAARMPMSLLFDQLAETDKRIERLTDEIEVTHEQSETSQRLATIPGVGMLTATIVAATTPDVDNFDCARACRERRLKHIRTKPYTPRTNGKAERFIQTALREWAYAVAYPTSKHRAAELPVWLHRYNWHRPHGSLKSKTPISRLGLTRDNLVRFHS